MAKPKYTIRIEKESGANKAAGERYRLSYGKQYGDFSGGVTGFKTKSALIRFVLKVFVSWQGVDHILGRISDPITVRNLLFEDRTGDFTIGDFIGSDGNPRKGRRNF